MCRAKTGEQACTADCVQHVPFLSWICLQSAFLYTMEHPRHCARIVNFLARRRKQTQCDNAMMVYTMRCNQSTQNVVYSFRISRTLFFTSMLVILEPQVQRGAPPSRPRRSFQPKLAPVLACPSRLCQQRPQVTCLIPGLIDIRTVLFAAKGQGDTNQPMPCMIFAAQPCCASKDTSSTFVGSF